MASLQRAYFISPELLLGCAIVYFVCVTVSNCWLDILVLSFLFFISSFKLDISFRRYARAISSAWRVALIAALIHFVFRVWFVSEADQSVWMSGLHTLFFVCRFVLLVFVTFALLEIHTPASYAESLATRSRFFLGKRVAGQAGHISMLAFSMLPQIEEQMAQRKLARQLRRIVPSRGFFKRVAFARTEAMSALQFSLNYANVLATVLWSRGFQSDRPIQLSKKRVQSAQSVWIAIVFCLFCLSTLLLKPIN